MAHVEKGIDIHVPVRKAYNQWTQFEEFPRFMEGVEKIEQLSEKRLHWRADIGGRVEEWEAEITEQVPDMRIAWQSVEGAKNAGVVTFHRLDDNNCRVMLQMKYDPESVLEKIGDALGFFKRRIAGDMERFKQFMESHGEETGAWRGEIPQEKQE